MSVSLVRAAVALALVLCANPAAAQKPAAQPPGEILVKFRAGASSAHKASLLAEIDARPIADFDFIGVRHLRLGAVPLEAALARLAADPSVAYAEPNVEIHLAALPNDPLFADQYPLRNTGQLGGMPGADIDAAPAWDIFIGDPELLIGVIDTGIDLTHPDLAPNLWTNPGEVAGNGIDDDHNGWVDDVHGYDFYYQDGDPSDDHGHGTHVAGILAARGDDGVGVAGVAWRARLVAIKVIGAGGSATVAHGIAGLQYAMALGIRLTNNSWGGGEFSHALFDAIEAAGAAGQTLVAAAGNDQQNIEFVPFYPASFPSAHVVSVTATDRHDQLASFANVGAKSVDLAAPGVEVLSTLPGGTWGLFSGTSMAAPHVTGALALLLGRFPGISAVQAKALVLGAAEPLPALAGLCVTGGRLAMPPPFLALDAIAPGGIADLAVVETGSSTVRLAWTATGDDGSTGRASRVEVRYAASPIGEASFTNAPLAASLDPREAGAAESFEVAGLPFRTTRYFALRAFDEYGNAGPLSNVVVATTLGPPDVSADTGPIVVRLPAGASRTALVSLRNVGEGTLDFTVSRPDLVSGTPAAPALVLAHGEPDPRPGFLGHGGPDRAGYRWRDSDDPHGPAYEWIDITGVGTRLPFNGTLDRVTTVPIGFAFPFYDGSYTQAHVCTHGWLSFSPTFPAFTNQGLPFAGAPANLIAPFWDDLSFFRSGNAWHHSDGERFVVSWIGVPFFAGGGPVTFQVVLHRDGRIVFQYRRMNPPVIYATIGIQNEARDDGLTVVFNAPYVHDDLAVQFVRLPEWMNVTPSSGRIAAGQSMLLGAKLSAAGLPPGVYEGSFQILTNDADEPQIEIPVRLTVFAPLTGESPTVDVPVETAPVEVSLARQGALGLVIELPEPAAVELAVFDVRGARVRDLATGPFAAGRHRADWNGDDRAGRRAAAGVYFVRLRAAGRVVTRRIALLP